MTPRSNRTPRANGPSLARRAALVAGLGLGAGAAVELLSSSTHDAGAAPSSTLLPAPPTPAPPGTSPPPTTQEPTPTTSTTLSEEELALQEEARHVEALRELEAGIQWKDSRAIGTPNQGRLEDGVNLPVEGAHYFTWDGPNKRVPSPDWRRWGTDRLVGLVLRVAEEFAADHPDAPRLCVGDLSRPEGGSFGRQYGGRGHVSHQNGLDVDIFYPRLDRAERAPDRVEQVDLRLAQDLVDRFVRARALFVFVGPRTDLRGPERVVQALRNHDDHLHVRLHPAV